MTKLTIAECGSTVVLVGLAAGVITGDEHGGAAVVFVGGGFMAAALIERIWLRYRGAP